jgi:ubiquinone/menaquinone biosynthesis C-methylase UbiE
MRHSTLELICCPTCRSELSLRGASPDKDSEGAGPEAARVIYGNLHCPVCDRAYPIEDGIPRFFEPQELEGPNRRFARFYDRFAPFYSILFKAAFLFFGGERKARMRILDRLELKGGRILEVSIGTGDNLPYLYESPDVREAYGIDISAKELARCRKRAEKRGWPADLFLAMAEALPFKADTFDSVFHIGGINFFTGRKQAVEEMIRVARPGSRIVIADEVEKMSKRLNPAAFSSSSGGREGSELTTLLDLVPSTMEEIRLDGIWKSHGKHHGYCLEFRKPATR